MLNEQITLLYPIVAIFLLLAVFVLYVYYTSDRHYRIKLLLGPTLLAACVFTVPFVGARLGYGWPTPLPASFQYFAHRTVVVGGEKQWIDVLLVSRKPLAADARLHRVPWTRKMEDVLEQANQMKEGPAGGEIVVNGPVGGSTARGSIPEYSMNRILPQDQMPKDAPRPSGGPRKGPQEGPKTQPTGPSKFSV
ncbi:MAG TPA: hypothetical protein VIU02_12595 [Burkholderiales bacterium]